MKGQVRCGVKTKLTWRPVEGRGVVFAFALVVDSSAGRCVPVKLHDGLYYPRAGVGQAGEGGRGNVRYRYCYRNPVYRQLVSRKLESPCLRRVVFRAELRLLAVDTVYFGEGHVALGTWNRGHLLGCTRDEQEKSGRQTGTKEA